MQYEMSREKLRHYFGNVTYIDDKFDFCLVNDDYEEQNEDDEGGPPLPKGADSQPEEASPQPGDTPKERELTDEEKSGINLIALVKKLNEDKYSDIRFHPVAYSQDSNPEKLYPQIITSPLTIIDWNLGGGNTAFSIIKHVFSQTQQLKVIVVYSASFQDAVASFNDDPELKCFPRIKEADRLQAYRCNNRSLLLIADKQRYNIISLLNFIINLFVDECGIMPIALIDFMESAHKVSDNLFGAFSDSVSDLYFLQMYYSHLNEYDSTETITLFMQNKFRDACVVNPQILTEFYQYQKNRLVAYVDSATAESTLQSSLDLLISHLGEQEKAFCQAMKNVSFATFKCCCEDAAIKSSNWIDVLDYFTSYIQEVKEQYINNEIDDLIKPYTNLELSPEFKVIADKHREKLRISVEERMKDTFDNFRKQILPLLLQLLISSGDCLSNGIELIKTIKYKRHDSPSLSDLLAAGKNLPDDQKADFLLNKLHFGDVLVKYQKSGNEYLLCLTPPCDIFRPDKTKFNLVYIRGVEVQNKDLNEKMKENAHLSFLPVYVKKKHKEEIRYINWRFFDIKKFNLKDTAEYEELCNWSRPYTMAEPYARQIANAFTAYFSRAGVDELFMKSENNLRRLFK